MTFDKQSLIEQATLHCTNILQHNLDLNPNQNVILIHQKGQGCDLNEILTIAYQTALRNLSHEKLKIIEFNPTEGEELRQFLFQLKKHDVAILIQNTNFRISNYRIRLDLKNRDCFVIEHTLLSLEPPKNYQTYINSLTFDQEHWQKVANNIIPKLNAAKELKIICEDNSVLTYTGPFEPLKQNLGDLKKTLGSFYPIGEIFTEAKNLEAVNGQLSIYIVPNKKYEAVILKPFQITIKDGKLISHSGPKIFQDIVDLVKTENENQQVWIREIGFGLNRYISKKTPLTFVSAHERQEGFHVSLGLKHGVFRKKLPKKHPQRFHIDMFIDLKEIKIDDKTIFKNKHFLTP